MDHPDNLCPLYSGDEETLNHLMFHCPAAVTVWKDIGCWAGAMMVCNAKVRKMFRLEFMLCQVQFESQKGGYNLVSGFLWDMEHENRYHL